MISDIFFLFSRIAEWYAELFVAQHRFWLTKADQFYAE